MTARGCRENYLRSAQTLQCRCSILGLAVDVGIGILAVLLASRGGKAPSIFRNYLAAKFLHEVSGIGTR
jgi:hypothetical protein